MIERFRGLFSVSSKIVILTGAGVSTDSGIPDFRGPDGLYKKYSQNIFDIQFFKKNTETFYKFARECLIPMVKAQSNVVHRLIAKMETTGKILGVITQNIDGLHQKAGSKNVVEIHGSVNRYYCMSCHRNFTVDHVSQMLEKTSIPTCPCGGVIRPDIVFFGEPLGEREIREAQKLSAVADLMIVFGSSLVVYPAAYLPVLTLRNGGKLIIVNKGETGLDDIADLKIDTNLSEFSKKMMSAGGIF